MSSAKRIIFGVIIGCLLLTCVFLAIANAKQQADNRNLHELTISLQKDLSNTINRIDALETELSNVKISMSTEFEITWRSLARVNSNFKALGTGFHLEEEDIAIPELGVQGALKRRWEKRQ